MHNKIITLKIGYCPHSSDTTRRFIRRKVHKGILNSENSKNHVIVSFLLKNCDYFQIYNMCGSNIVVLEKALQMKICTNVILHGGLFSTKCTNVIQL